VRLRIAEKQRGLIPRDEAIEVLEGVIGMVLTHLSGMAARCTRDLTVRRNGRGCQEQIQIIATAIGKPMAKAAAIVDVNANSKSSAGCTLSRSGMAYSKLEGQKAVTGTKR
jgi:hypothetical protein